MNAHTTTAKGIALAVTGRTRVKQTVHKCRSENGGSLGPRYIVLVIPEGQDRGEYYSVGPHAYEALRDGEYTPEDLELDPISAEEADEDECEREFDLKQAIIANARRRVG